MSAAEGAENTRSLDQLNKFEKLSGRPPLRVAGQLKTIRCHNTGSLLAC
uniref:Uncharacterized protein n=1 Tax=Anguilla anguilla TaxID=7936 RepID=A0A0E9X2E8_ANGAN